MDNLEEKLRNSRHKERPDLKPPAGGWEAVQAGLAASAAAAGTATASAAGKAAVVAKTSWWVVIAKALLAVVVLGSVAAGGYALAKMEDASASGERPSRLVAPPGAPTADPVEAATSPIFRAETREGTPTTNSSNASKGAATAASAQRATTGNSTIHPAASPSSNAPSPAGAPRAEHVPVTEPVVNPTTSPSVPPAAVSPADLPASAGNVPPELPAGLSPVVMDTLTEAATAPPSRTEAEPASPPVVLPLLSTGARRAVAPVRPAPIALRGEVSPAKFRTAEHRFSRQEWTAWQIHGGYSTLIWDQGFYPIDESIYAVADTGDPFSYDIPLADGSNLQLTRVGHEDARERTLTTSLYRLGVTRQTHWGGTLRATLNHYRYRYSEKVPPNVLANGQAVLVWNDKTQATYLDVDFQYTLRRRHRFRPYVGVGLILANRFKEEKGNKLEGLNVGDLLATNPSSFTTVVNPDITVQAGFQYQLTNRFSAGVNVWTSGSRDLVIDAPYGLEARYIIK